MSFWSGVSPNTRLQRTRLRAPPSRKSFAGTIAASRQRRWGGAIPIAMLAASLISSTGCSSAAQKPSPAAQEPAAGSNCENVEAPKLIRRVEPDYPAAVRKQRIEGKVVVEAVLTPDATLEGIKIVSSPSEALSKLALKAFRQWRYKPAFCRDLGKSIRVYVTMTTTFSLH